MLPGEVTRVIAKFDRKGEYVWHCHILSHEEHDMMRPLVVLGTSHTTVFDVQPASVTVTAKVGGTIGFAIAGGVGPYQVTQLPALYPKVYPPVMNAAGDGFTVTIKNGAAPGTITYTVTDSSVPAQTKTATLNII